MESLSPIIGLSGFILSIINLYRTRVIAKNSNTMPVFGDLMKQYRESVQESFYYISNLSNDKKLNLGKIPISELEDETKKHALKVSHYFDNIGLLVSSNLIWEKYILNFLGHTSYEAWKILKNYIEGEREKRKLNNGDIFYQMHFEYFAQRFIEYNFQNQNFYNKMIRRRKQLNKYPMFGIYEI